MRSFFAITALAALSAFVGAAASSSSQNNASGSSNQSGTDAAQAQQQAAVPTTANPDKPKAKPKKIWTNDEMPSAADGGISVVGNNTKPSSKKTANVSANEKQVTALRERLHQLNNEMEQTDKKISELRNFRAENTSASGGINMSHRYSNTPVEDQIKTLEDKKKQIQAQIEGVEDQARKNGIEPGQLR